MPALAKLSPHAEHTNPFHYMAREVHKLLNKPLGTEHARVLKLAEVLKSMAETNYQRGYADALASLEIVPETPQEPEGEHIFNANKELAIGFIRANPDGIFRVSIQPHPMAEAAPPEPLPMTVHEAKFTHDFYSKYPPNEPEAESRWAQARNVLLAAGPTTEQAT